MGKSELMATVLVVVASAVVMFVVAMIMGGFYCVSAGEAGVKFTRIGSNNGFTYEELPQGCGLKVPFAQSVYKLPFKTQTIGFYGGDEQRGTYSAITPKDKNGIDFSVDLTVRYRLDVAQIAEFAEQKGVDIDVAEQIIATAARADSTRGVFGKYSQEDVPENRITIAEEIRGRLQQRVDLEASGKLQAGYIIIEAVDFRNVKFNQEIEDRIIKKQTRLQEAEEMVYNIEIANKTRQKELIDADRDKQAAIIRAEGLGEAIKIEAFAKAEGIQKVNDAYQSMPGAYVSTKWADAIQENDKIIFGLDNLGGNLLPIIDVNEVAALKTSGKIGNENHS